MTLFIQNFRNITATTEPWWTILLVPIWQEVLFRYLPFRFWYVPLGNFWLVGIVSSIVFASIHWYFGKWFVLYAFGWGVILWWIMTAFGLVAAILVHAIVNVVDLLVGWRVLLRPNKKE